MSKIKIKSVLISDEKHEFQGFGLKNGHKIIYNDHNIKTVITLGETVYLERKSDYLLFLAFKEQKTLTGSYSNNYGKIDLEVKTKLLKQKENSLEIEYTLINNKQKISDFKFILEYSIDT